MACSPSFCADHQGQQLDHVGLQGIEIGDPLGQPLQLLAKLVISGTTLVGRGLSIFCSRRLSTLRRPKLLHQQRQGFVQLESVAGGAGEEESALSNKASSLEFSLASRPFSFSSRSISHSINFVRFLLSCSRLSLSSDLICASTVGCQFNLDKKRRKGGKEERNSDLLINLELQESEDIDMAIGGEEGDQRHQKACCQRDPAHRIKRWLDLARIGRLRL